MASLKTLNTGDIKILTKTVVNFKSQSQIYIYIYIYNEYINKFISYCKPCIEQVNGRILKQENWKYPEFSILNLKYHK